MDEGGGKPHLYTGEGFDSVRGSPEFAGLGNFSQLKNTRCYLVFFIKEGKMPNWAILWATVEDVRTFYENLPESENSLSSF